MNFLLEEEGNLSKYPTMEEEGAEIEEEPSDEEKIMKMLEKQGWKMGEGEKIFFIKSDFLKVWERIDKE